MALGFGNALPFVPRGMSQGPVIQRLLDLYPGAAAAYSTRQLNGAYPGAALRVRRDSDNAEQDIGFAEGVLNEGALTTFVGAGSAFVTTWYDQSGNARHATQTTAANQPRIVNAGVVFKKNGRVALDAVDQYFSTAIPALPQPFTSFTVLDRRTTASGIDETFFRAGTTGAGIGAVAFFNWGSQNGELGALAGVYYQRGLTALNATFSNAIVWNGAASVHSVNGVDFTVNLGPESLGENPNLLSRNVEAGRAPANTAAHEMIFYPDNQASNRAAIEADIMEHFGITP